MPGIWHRLAYIGWRAEHPHQVDKFTHLILQRLGQRQVAGFPSGEESSVMPRRKAERCIDRAHRAHGERRQRQRSSAGKTGETHVGEYTYLSEIGRRVLETLQRRNLARQLLHHRREKLDLRELRKLVDEKRKAPACMITRARPLPASAEIFATASRCSSETIGPSPVLPAIQNPPHPCEIVSSSSARKVFSLMRPSAAIGVGAPETHR
jgi:hypothetical protein